MARPVCLVIFYLIYLFTATSRAIFPTSLRCCSLTLLLLLL
jgi:hypothetical protein